MTDFLLLEIATRERRVLGFDYDGAFRFVEPHALGRKADGSLLLRGFQTGGASDTLNFGWKLFTVSKIENLTLAPPRAGFAKGDKAMVGGIIEEVRTGE